MRRVSVGDSDLLLTLFTRERGLVTTAARGARGPKSKFGPLEPLHTLRVRLELSSRSDVAKLREATVAHPRLALCEDAERLDAASRLLRWVRALSPSHEPEGKAFALLDAALDRLEEADRGAEMLTTVAIAGLSLAAAFGYRLELDACVRCGTPCPAGASAYVDVGAGGVVCTRCGGGGLLLRGSLRETLSRGTKGAGITLSIGEAESAVDLAERVIGSHTRGQDARK